LIGGISKWEIAVTVKFFGSLSYSYYFSVAVEITTVDVVADVTTVDVTTIHVANVT